MNTLVRPDGITVCSNEVVEVAYSGVELGNTAERFESSPGEALSNLNKLRNAVSIGRHTLILAQQKAKFLDLGGISLDALEAAYETDGIFTDSSEVAVSIRPADCTVMVFHSARGEKVMGLIHGGYLGIEGDIHLAALEAMTGDYGIAINDVRIFFAPQIRAASYFFKKIRPEQLADKRWSRHIRFTGGYYHIDTLSRVVTDLNAHKIGPSQITISPIDTGSDPAYFSHARTVRTGEPEGRNGVVAKLR